jgi:hypothetical protein
LAILAGILETGSVLTSNLPFEAYSVGDKTAGSADNDLNWPTVESLTEMILRAFHQTDSLMTVARKEPEEKSEDLASQIESEARVMEAEARKLEAQARKLEALARIRTAECNSIS